MNKIILFLTVIACTQAYYNNVRYQERRERPAPVRQRSAPVRQRPAPARRQNQSSSLRSRVSRARAAFIARNKALAEENKALRARLERLQARVAVQEEKQEESEDLVNNYYTKHRAVNLEVRAKPHGNRFRYYFANTAENTAPANDQHVHDDEGRYYHNRDSRHSHEVDSNVYGEGRHTHTLRNVSHRERAPVRHHHHSHDADHHHHSHDADHHHYENGRTDRYSGRVHHTTDGRHYYGVHNRAYHDANGRVYHDYEDYRHTHEARY